jgi:chemotaxis protein MotB
VLLLSFANMDVQNFRTALGSVKEAFGVQFKTRGDVEAMATSPVELSNVQSSATLYETTAIDAESIEIVEQFVRSQGLEDVLEVEGDARGVIVRAKDRVLFDSGSATLRDEGVPVLLSLADLFRSFQGTLAIEGHTDNRPISTAQFPSNWELSGSRAAAVLRYMISDGLDSERAKIAGYADLRPVTGNDDDASRAQNRRVEFVFEYDEEFAGDPAAAFDVSALGLDEDDILAGARERGEDEIVVLEDGGAPRVPAVDPWGELPEVIILDEPAAEGAAGAAPSPAPPVNASSSPAPSPVPSDPAGK